MIDAYLPVFVSLAATFVFALVYSYLQEAVRQRSANMKRPVAIMLAFALYAIVFLLIGVIIYFLTTGMVELMRGNLLTWISDSWKGF